MEVFLVSLSEIAPKVSKQSWNPLVPLPISCYPVTHYFCMVNCGLLFILLQASVIKLLQFFFVNRFHCDSYAISDCNSLIIISTRNN